MFTGLKQNHKDIRESGLNFVMEQTSDFKLSIKLSAIYHFQMDIIEQVKNFDLMKHFCLSLRLPS